MNVDLVVHGSKFNAYPTVKHTKCRNKMPSYVQSVPLFEGYPKKIVGYRYIYHRQPISPIK